MKRYFSFILLFAGAALSLYISGCDDDPEKEDVPELVTKIKLTFTPVTGGSPVVVTAVDPDGEGPQDLTPDGSINLRENTTYQLSIELFNDLLNPGEEGYDLTEEIEEEADEHQFFFGFSSGVFSSPSGTGNIAPSTGSINYLDEDSNGRPLGLLTEWTTAGIQSGKSFRVVLKHQPGIKSATSTSADGETDVDVTFALSITGS
ncbi:MAG: hypothetical protein N2044_07570 [Cyclobacteriaceae bacterium]|nr:hypothetical protein [Cyclobacteriaceae bacterium]MCX7637686.1 hypothetical protein [Cyclobacteriaceae bacterium]MDW8330808.1 hypothetical protein [Cyclobacteriaceae bacterium]